MALSPWWLFNTALGNSEGLLAAAVVWAVVAHVAGHRRAALALATAAALMRPEVWPFLAAYGLWLWRDERRAVIAVAVIVPLLWFGPDVIGAGGALDASRTARGVASPDSAKNASIPALAVLADTADVLTLPALVAAVIAAVAGGPLARWIAAAAAGWIVVVAAMTVAGYAGNPRYLVAAAALGAALAGAGAVRAAGAAGAAILVAAVLATTLGTLRVQASDLGGPRRLGRSVRRRDRRRRRARRTRALRTYPHQRVRSVARRLAPRPAAARPRRDAVPPGGRDPRPLVLRRRPRTAPYAGLPHARHVARLAGHRVLPKIKGPGPFIFAAVEIVVHGGAGNWREESHDAARDGVERAVDAGYAVLADGGDALDAVQAAVIVLEDDPVFNAGRGAVLDERGFVLLDASVMRGADRAAGAVAAVRGIRNPVLAARAVLEEGRHVMLAGRGGREVRARGRAGHRARGVVPDRRAPARVRGRRHRRRGRPGRAWRRGRGHLDRRHERQAPRPRRRLADHRAPGRGPTTPRPRSPAPATARRSSATRWRTRSTRCCDTHTCRSTKPASGRSRAWPVRHGGPDRGRRRRRDRDPVHDRRHAARVARGDGPTTVAIDG